MPQERYFSWHVPYSLDLEKMGRASRYFLGEHDFSSFCNVRKNLNYTHTKRTIEAVELLTPHVGSLIFAIRGDHFLYKMVRNVVGTLVFVGLGKIEPEEIPLILAARSRVKAGMTAPAHALTLKNIYYPQECTPRLE
jgi:tRNA pseudouridine38-40 synthase